MKNEIAKGPDNCISSLTLSRNGERELGSKGHLGEHRVNSREVVPEFTHTEPQTRPLRHSGSVGFPQGWATASQHSSKHILYLDILII